MKYFNSILLLILLLSVAGCEPEILDVPIPEITDSQLKGTKNLTDFMKNNIDGVFITETQTSPFGDSVVFKWNSGHINIFTGKNTTYAVLDAGFNEKDEELVFEGYWRQANSSATGALRLKILSGDGGKDLADGKVPTSIKVTGEYMGTEGNNFRELEFRFVRKFYGTKNDFYIIAHKGGGRNIDRLPHAENSKELIEYAERLGANSIEIDVQLTKDKVPVLFHDEYLSKRTINQDYFIGKISDYTFKQLSAFVTLRKYSGTENEEKIPTLADALTAVVNNTNLKLVWLDIKTPDVIPYVVPIQKKALELSKSTNRKLEILIGIPDEDILAAVKSQQDYKSIPTLCEMDENYVLDAGSVIWAPRWSNGLMTDRVSEMHQKGKRVFVWTMDDPALIKTYVRSGDFDGIVTNFSPSVAYEYYMGK
jgi:glycerophosphoryl diester phosphodiesterase